MKTLYDLAGPPEVPIATELPTPEPIVAINCTFTLADWVMLPDGNAIPKELLGPCPCGNWVFDLFQSFDLVDGEKLSRIRVACPYCSKAQPSKTDRGTGKIVRTSETAIGTLDNKTAKVKVTIDGN